MKDRIRNFVFALWCGGLAALCFWGMSTMEFSSNVSTEVGVRGGDGGIPVPDWVFFVLGIIFGAMFAIGAIVLLWKAITGKS